MTAESFNPERYAAFSVPHRDEPRPLTVSQLNAAVKSCLEANFPRVWVAGELAELTIHPTGHVYFTLKDPDTGAQVKGVAFRYRFKALADKLEKGTAVQVYGSISLFEQYGAYQLYATAITPSGLGELNRKLQELKARLAAEGLFDPSRKRPIPRFPKVVGLITAPTGAAIQDFLRNVTAPYGGLQVKFVPAAVQGNDAVRQITAALNYLSSRHECDVIVVTRGGGGQEDLIAFNDETLVRAIAASELPVVSAVGHDRDLSLCDLAADLAVSTPTAAANLLVRGKLDLCARLDNATAQAIQCLQRMLMAYAQRYQKSASCTFLNKPLDWINRLAQRLDYATARLDAALPNLATRQKNRLQTAGLRLAAARPILLTLPQRRLQDSQARLDAIAQNTLTPARNRLQRCQSMLMALNPTAVLTRGYAILLKDNGQAVRSPLDTADGEHLKALLARGELHVKTLPATSDQETP